MTGPRGKAEFLNGPPQGSGRRRGQGTETIHLFNAQTGVARYAGSPIPLRLEGDRRPYTTSHESARFSERPDELIKGARLDRYPDVDPVQEGSSETPSISREVRDRAKAGGVLPAKISTRTRIGGENKLEVRGIAGRPAGSHNRDPALFQRLPKRLKHIAAELRRFIEEENASVREAYLPRAPQPAAADHSLEGRGVMRKTEGRPKINTFGGIEETSERMDRRHLDRFGLCQIRKQAGETSGRHGFPRAGRTEEKNVVTPCSGDLESAAERGLAAQLREIAVRGGGDAADEARSPSAAGGGRSLSLPQAHQNLDGLGQPSYRMN